MINISSSNNKDAGSDSSESLLLAVPFLCNNVIVKVKKNDGIFLLPHSTLGIVRDRGGFYDENKNDLVMQMSKKYVPGFGFYLRLYNQQVQ